MKLAFVIDPGERVPSGVKPAIRRTLQGATRAFVARPSGITVRFATTAAMQALNRDWRGKDRPTDVLSFPLEGQTSEGERYLGDIALCLAIATQQARRRRHRLERETALLALHGYLHLLGYDHETDAGEMEALERRLRRTLLPPRA